MTDLHSNDNIQSSQHGTSSGGAVESIFKSVLLATLSTSTASSDSQSKPREELFRRQLLVLRRNPHMVTLFQQYLQDSKVNTNTAVLTLLGQFLFLRMTLVGQQVHIARKSEDFKRRREQRRRVIHQARIVAYPNTVATTPTASPASSPGRRRRKTFHAPRPTQTASPRRASVTLPQGCHHWKEPKEKWEEKKEDDQVFLPKQHDTATTTSDGDDDSIMTISSDDVSRFSKGNTSSSSSVYSHASSRSSTSHASQRLEI